MISIKEKAPVNFKTPNLEASKHGFGTSKHGFLQFSQKLDYGLFLLMELANKQLHRDETPVSLRTVADENGMSFFFLQKIALELRKGGLIRAGRGKNGGYLLAKPCSQISLRSIIEILEGPLIVLNCLSSNGIPLSCARTSKCKIRHGLGTVNQAIVNIFTQTSLQSLLASNNAV